MLKKLDIEKTVMIDIRQKMTGFGNEKITNLIALPILLPGMQDTSKFIIESIKSELTQTLRDKIPKWFHLKDGSPLSYDDLIEVQERFKKLQNGEEVKLKSWDIPVAERLGLYKGPYISTSLENMIKSDLDFKPEIMFKRAMTNQLSSFLDIKMMGIVMEQAILKSGIDNQQESAYLEAKEKRYQERIEEFAATMLLLKHASPRDELKDSFKLLYDSYFKSMNKTSSSFAELNPIEARIVKLIDDPNENVKKIIRQTDIETFTRVYPKDNQLFLERESSPFSLQIR